MKARILLFDAQTIRSRLENLYQVAGRWEVWLASAVLGGVLAVAGYASFKHSIAGYSDFVVGFITLEANGKAGEYAAAFAFLLGMAAAFHGLAYIITRISAQSGTATADALRTRLIIAVTPAILWGTTSLWPMAERVGFYWGAVALVSFTMLGAIIALSRPNVWLNTENVRLIAIIEGAVLFPIAFVFAAHGLVMIDNTIGLMFGPGVIASPQALYQTVAVAGSLGAAAISIIGFTIKSTDRAIKLIRTILTVVQVPALGLFLVFLPLPFWTQDLGPHYPDPIRTSNWVLFGALFMFGLADLLRVWRNGNRSSANPAAVISGFILIAIIVYARIPVPAPVPVPFDDYHAAENFVPWWSAVKHGMVPLWDFSPARGLINYLPGALAALFIDDTAAGLISTSQVRVLLIVLLVFPAVALAIGKWPAFFIMSFATLDDGPGTIDTLMAAGLALLCWAWLHLSRVNWLILWFVVGVAAVLIAPGQGGVLVLATMPAGLWQLYHAVRDDRRQVIRLGALVLVVTAVLLFATPLGLMVAGAVRYGAGQSSVNGIANGIPWQFGTQSYINSSIFEVLRFSWLGVGAMAIVITLWTWTSAARTPQRSVALFAGTTVALLCLIFITRSVVRLDLGFVGRPGWASIWALTLLLPILVHYALPERKRLTVLIATVGVGSMLTANFSLVGLEFMYDRPILLRTAPPADQHIARGSELGLPNLGVVAMDKVLAARLKTVKEQLDALLAPHETFLDLTNNGAQYFYFDRPPPSESTAVYNLITPAQQLRTVKTVHDKQVPVVLIGPHTVPVDGLYANLRAYLVYRYALLNYQAVTINGFDYLIRADRFDKVREAFNLTPLTTDGTITVTDRNFPIGDVGNLARSMGRSADQLNKHTRIVHGLDVSTAQIMGAVRTDNGALVAQGTPISVSFDLSSLNLSGKEAGLLQFHLDCADKPMKWPLSVSWVSHGAASTEGTLTFAGRNGTHILPLDSAARWLLSPALNTLTLTINGTPACRSLTLSDVKLLQRLDADKADALAKAAPAKYIFNSPAR